MLVQIDHVINHMFLANHNKTQTRICNFYIFNIYSVLIVIYILFFHYELKKVVEVTYNCKNVKGNNETGAIRKKIIFDFFFN